MKRPAESDPIAFDKPTLEIQQLREQVAKLRVEIETLNESSEWNRGVGRYLPLATTFVAVVGLSLGVWQFNVGRRDAVMKEVARPFWEKQLEIYVQAADAAAQIAVEPDPEKSKGAQVTFWKLYWGPMSCVEDVTLASLSKGKSSEVEAAMVAFGKALLPQDQGPSGSGYKGNATPIELRHIDPKLATELRPLALRIAHKMREQLTPSFDLKIAPPPKEQKMTGAIGASPATPVPQQ